MVLSFFEMGLPHPLKRRRVCTPPPLYFRGRHTCLWDMGVGGPNSDEGTLWYSRYIWYFVVSTEHYVEMMVDMYRDNQCYVLYVGITRVM
jgi:hypothetical protein